MKESHYSLSSSELAQIEQAIIQQGGGKYLELRIEFCDHLVTAIEEQWKQDPGLSFEKSLQQELAKFGYAGLQVLSKNREGFFVKKYQAKAWRLFKIWWRWPKALLSFLSVLVVWQVLRNSPNEDTQSIIYGFLALLPYLSLIPHYVRHHQIKKQQAVKVLATKMITQAFIIFIIGYHFFYGFLINGMELLQFSWGSLLSAFALVSFWIFTFGIVPRMFRESWAVAERLQNAI